MLTVITAPTTSAIYILLTSLLKYSKDKCETANKHIVVALMQDSVYLEVYLTEFPIVVVRLAAYAPFYLTDS